MPPIWYRLCGRCKGPISNLICDNCFIKSHIFLDEKMKNSSQKSWNITLATLFVMLKSIFCANFGHDITNLPPWIWSFFLKVMKILEHNGPFCEVFSFKFWYCRFLIFLETGTKEMNLYKNKYKFMWFISKHWQNCPHTIHN